MSIKCRVGRPRFGKTYTVVADSLERMANGRIVYSNFPIISLDKKLSSRIWIPEMVYESLFDCDIVIDEAYVDYSSRDRDGFVKDVHTFFATNGHNGLNITLIAQNAARIDVIIRELFEVFEMVEKIEVPIWLWLPYAKLINQALKYGLNPLKLKKPLGMWDNPPLWFNVYGFDTETKYKAGVKSVASTFGRYWFKKEIAGAYDTHYYRHEDDVCFSSPSWLEHFETGCNVTLSKLGNKKSV